jgi:hypothetical protein
MSKPPKTDFMALISGEVAPAAMPEPEPPEAPVVALRPRAAPARKPVSGTLKQRAHQLSVYLEPEVYDRLRDIAHDERTKLHALLLEAVDLLLKRRGQPSIKELIRKNGGL